MEQNVCSCRVGIWQGGVSVEVQRYDTDYGYDYGVVRDAIM